MNEQTLNVVLSKIPALTVHDISALMFQYQMTDFLTSTVPVFVAVFMFFWGLIKVFEVAEPK